MAGNVKGITIEIDGNTTKLQSALKDVDGATKTVNSELKQVNGLLKFNPGNTELLAQKQELLAKQVQNTESRLKTLKSAQAQVEAQFKSGDMGEEEYRAFQRELTATEGKLNSYKGQLKSAQSAQSEYGSATNRLNGILAATGKDVTQFETILGGKLTSAIREGTASTSQLNTAFSKIASASGVARSDVTELAGSFGKFDGSDNSIKSVTSALGEMQEKSDSAKNSLDQISQNTFSEKLQNVSDGAQQAGQGIQEFGSKAIDAWSEMDESVDNLTAKTGANGEAAAELGENYEHAETTMAGAQMESSDLSNTMAGLKSMFGLTGDQLESTTDYVSKFSVITGQSGTDAVNALHNTMSKFNVSAKETPGVLDALAAASQSSGVSVDKLEQSAADAYPVFSQLHIGLKQGIGIIASWSKGGVDAQTALKGMAKASTVYAAENKSMKDGITDTFNAIKNAKTPTDALNAGVEAFGARAAPKMVAAIKDGKVSLNDLKSSAADTGGTVAKSFETTIDPADKAKQAEKEYDQAMASLGGTIQETLGPILKALVPILKSVANVIKESPAPVKAIIVVIGALVVALGALAPIITAVASVMGVAGTAAGTSAIGFGALSTSLLPIIAVIAAIAAAIAAIILVIKNWGAIVDWLKNVWNGVANFFSSLWTGIKQIFSVMITAIVADVQAKWAAVVNVTTAVWNGIKTFFTELWDGIKAIFTLVVQAIIAYVTAEWNAIKLVTTTVFNTVSAVVSAVWNGIKTVFTTVVGAISSAVSAAWNVIKSATSTIFYTVSSIVSSAWNSIKSVISSVVSGVKSVVSGGWNVIKSATSTIFNTLKTITTSAWNSIKSTVSGAVNGVKSTVSSVWNAIKSVTSSAWNGIKSAISGPINAAKDAVARGISAIKSLFNFHISWPHIPLPHFSISGKFNPLKGQIPHIGVSWYAKGGIMTKPTMFASNGNNISVGGEAGPEAVLPLNAKTLAGIGAGIAEQMDGGTINVTVQVMADTTPKTIKKIQTAVVDGITKAQNARKRAVGGA